MTTKIFESENERIMNLAFEAFRKITRYSDYLGVGLVGKAIVMADARGKENHFGAMVISEIVNVCNSFITLYECVIDEEDTHYSRSFNLNVSKDGKLVFTMCSFAYHTEKPKPSNV